MPRAEGGRGGPFRRIAAPLGAGAVLGILAACSGLPGLLEEPPAPGGWTRLPLRSWVVEGGIAPRSIMACRPPDCAPGLAVGLFHAEGPEARRLEAALRSPAAFEAGLGRLAEERRARARHTRHGRRNLGSRAAVVPWRGQGASGLRITLTRNDGARTAHGIVLARRGARGLEAAIVAGETPEVVERAAEGAARSGL